MRISRLAPVLGGLFRILIVLELQANVPHGSVSSQTIALTTAVYSFYLPLNERQWKLDEHGWEIDGKPMKSTKISGKWMGIDGAGPVAAPQTGRFLKRFSALFLRLSRPYVSPRFRLIVAQKPRDDVQYLASVVPPLEEETSSSRAERDR